MDDARDIPEELEELESLEEAGDGGGEPGGVGEAGSEFLLSQPGLRGLALSQARNPAPFAILDGHLRFVMRNAAFGRLLAEYGHPAGPGMAETFRAVLRQPDREALDLVATDPAGHHFWKAHLEHRSSSAAGRVSKAILLPLWASAAPGGPPDAFALYLDDITEERRLALRQTYESLLKASLKKDNDTGAHVERVNRYASVLAAALRGDQRWPEVNEDFIEGIGFLAAMHDVGKLGTPDDILNKKGDLDEKERDIMRQHTVNGAYILAGYPNPMGRQIAQYHHEWWNGSGYPFNVMGPSIPLAARIVAIADVYDALRMRRIYKPPYPHREAVERIQADSGTHFDPELVEVLLDVDPEFERIYASMVD